MPKLQVVVGSTRPTRAADRVVPWVVERAQAHGGFEVELLDLRDWPLPFFQEHLGIHQLRLSQQADRIRRLQRRHRRRHASSRALGADLHRGRGGAAAQQRPDPVRGQRVQRERKAGQPGDRDRARHHSRRPGVVLERARARPGSRRTRARHIPGPRRGRRGERGLTGRTPPDDAALWRRRRDGRPPPLATNSWVASTRAAGSPASPGVPLPDRRSHAIAAVDAYPLRDELR